MMKKKPASSPAASLPANATVVSSASNALAPAAATPSASATA